nr:MAG TPA: tail tape measure protein [Caudoviricetes sp.]
MAGLKFDITGDNSNMLSALQGVQNGVRQTEKVVEQSGAGIEEMFGKMQSAATAMIGAFSLQQLASKVMSVRGEFQQLEVAFTTMLGSAEKANTLMDQLVKTAAITPFDLQGVANGAKQLLAYGIQADEVNETLVKLGDIAAGLSIPLNDLVYLYGTTMVQGRMFTQDLRQFQGRGVPIAEELAKQFGVAKEEVGDLVSAGKVGAEEFKRAITSMTSEGGKFAGLMENQSRTITGQISNIEDAIDTMFNEIGKKNEGLINAGLSGVSYLVENWETIGKVVLEVAVAYGTYKAALLAVYAAQKAQVVIESVSAFFSLAKSVHTAKDAMLLFNMATKANPIGLVVSVIASAATALYLFSKSANTASKAQETLNKVQEEAAVKAAEEKTKIDLLVSAAKNEKLSIEERERAIRKLNSIVPNYNAQLDVTTKRYNENKAALDNYLKSLANKYELEGAKDKLKEIGKQIAEININKRKAEKELKEAEDFNSKSTGSGFRAPQSQAETAFLNNNLGVAQRAVTDANRKLENVLAERKLIYDTYGVKLEKDAVGTTSAKSEKSIKDQIKETQDELNALSYKEAAGRKGAELRKKIRELQEKAKVYSPSYETSRAKGGVKGDDDSYERIEAIKGYEKNILEQQKETELALRQQNIDLKEESFEKEIEQINLNYDRLKAENEKRRNGMIEALKENRVNMWLERNPKATKSQQARYKDSLDLTEDDLNKKQRDQLSEYDRIADEQKKKATADLFKAQQAALYDYLKEYGTVQEQMYAIAKEYDEKIAKEQDENRKKSLEKEKENALAKANIGNLALDIDWGATFSGIGSVLKDIAKETLKEVEQYMRSLEFKSLSPTDKKSYADLRDKLRSEGSGETSSPFKFSQWGEIEKQTRAYQESVRNLKEKTKEHTNAIAELREAEKELSNAMTETSRSISLAKVEEARERVSSTAADLNNAKVDKDNKKGTLRDSTDKAVQGLNDFSSALQQMSSGTLKGFADGVANVISSIGGKGVGGLIGALGSKAGGLIGAILQIIDALGDDPTGFIKGLLDKIAKVVETILQQLPELIVGIIKGIGNILGSIISGIGSWFVGGGNEKEMEKEISKLAKSNEILAQRIEELSKNINKKDNTNEQSLEAYKKAKAAEDEWESNQRKAINARAGEWTNKGYGFLGLGGKKSFNALSRGRDWWGWKDFNEKLAEMGSKSRVFSVQDMWKLTPEEMKALRSYKDTAWREFFDNGGHKNPEDLVNQYIDRAGKREELTSALNEKLTGYSWDGFMDSYKSALKNLESTTADFANNINEMISNALLESFTNEELKPRIKALYDYIAKAAEDGLDSGEIDYIRKKNDEIAALGLKKRSELEQAGIIRRKDSEQNASANGVSNITYEQANNIVALTTAGNISRDQIKDLVNSMIANVSAMATLSSSTNSAVLEIRNLMIYNNSYLEDILKCTKSIYADFSKKIDDVNKNLKEMK